MLDDHLQDGLMDHNQLTCIVCNPMCTLANGIEYDYTEEYSKSDKVCMYVCMCVCVCERDRERAYVCVCVCVWLAKCTCIIIFNSVYVMLFQGESLIDSIAKLSDVVKSKSAVVKSKMINYIKNEQPLTERYRQRSSFLDYPKMLIFK